MLDYTISLKESVIQFLPSREQPDLALLLPPTARVGRADDNVHLDPIPVHGFFNGVALGHWLAKHNGISVSDGVVVYVLHDILKSFLHFTYNESREKRDWEHIQLFDTLAPVLRSCGVF